MNYHAALDVLGLDDDDGLTRDQVRRTYMRKLRECSPEKDPEGFRRVREAYELLRQWVPADAEPPPRFELRVESSAPIARDASTARADEPAVVVPLAAPPSLTMSPVADAPAADDPLERWRAAESQPAPAVDPAEALRARLRAIAGGEQGRQEAERAEQEAKARAEAERRREAEVADDDDDDDDDGSTYRLRGGESTRAYGSDDADDGDEDEDGDDDTEDDDAADPAVDDDDSSDDDTADDDERGPDHGPPDLWGRPRERMHGQAARPGVEPAKPGMTLDNLVEKILLLFSLEEVDEAIALHETWKDDADSDDHRQASVRIAARWALTRELLGVAAALPRRVVSVLAKSLAEDDLPSAHAELDAYRRANLPAARDADYVLRTRAKDLHRPIAGALYVEPPPQTFTTYASPEPQRSGWGAWWIVAMVILAVIKFAARSDTSSSSYTSNDYRTSSYPSAPMDEEAMRGYREQLARMMADEVAQRERDSRTMRAPANTQDPFGIPKRATKDELAVWIQDALDNLRESDWVTHQQRQAMNAMSLLAPFHTECKLAQEALELVEEQERSLAGYQADFVEKNLAAIRARLTIMCVKKARKPKARPPAEVEPITQ